MLRLLADENFNGAIVRGLLRLIPDLDIVTVQEIGLAGASDPEVLEMAASANRLLLTHDVNTVPHFVAERIRAGKFMPGVIEVATTFPIGRAIQDIILIVQCSREDEWVNLIVHIPL